MSYSNNHFKTKQIGINNFISALKKAISPLMRDIDELDLLRLSSKSSFVKKSLSRTKEILHQELDKNTNVVFLDEVASPAPMDNTVLVLPIDNMENFARSLPFGMLLIYYELMLDALEPKLIILALPALRHMIYSHQNKGVYYENNYGQLSPIRNQYKNSIRTYSNSTGNTVSSRTLSLKDLNVGVFNAHDTLRYSMYMALLKEHNINHSAIHHNGSDVYSLFMFLRGKYDFMIQENNDYIAQHGYNSLVASAGKLNTVLDNTLLRIYRHH